MTAARRVLVLGGAGEARRAAEALASAPALEVIFSRVGLVAAAAPAGVVARTGGFGGLEGLVGYLRAEEIAAVLNAAHPFAARITENAARAAAAAGLPYARLERPAWRAEPGDDWTIVSDFCAAAAAPAAGERVFLALGRGGSAAFAARDDLWRAARAAEGGAPIPGVDHLEIGPPLDAAAEAELFRRLRIDRLVARNSGGAAGRGKLEAARALGLPTVMIARPPSPGGRVFTAVDAAVDWARAVAGSGAAGAL